MTRSGFDLKLKLLNEDLLNMVGAVEKQIDDSIKALKEKDEVLAEKVIKDDDVIDKYEEDIEDKCIRMMATEQPLASDLRRLFITIKIVTDLERMADHAVDIAKIALAIKNEEYIKELIHIPRMAEIVEKMIKGAVEVYVSRNVKLAYEICDMDDEVDRIYEDVFVELINIMSKDGTTINQASRFLFVCKYLERIGDHATNICEEALYLETGNKLKLN